MAENHIGYVHSLESFGSVDGPGVRYVIFMSGCPMRCLYCHNPDTWNMQTGTQYTAQQLIKQALKYRPYWGDKGGITVSGGEPLLQIDFLIELFTLAKKNNINTCLDTSGVVFDPNDSSKMQKFDRLVAVTDLVMLDIKHIDDEQHKKLTQHSNVNILKFAQYLNEKNVKMWIRHVVVPNITDSRKELLAVGKFLKKFDNIEKIETLPYHTLGKMKYDKLGLEYPLGDTPPLDEKDAEKALEIIKEGMKYE